MKRVTKKEKADLVQDYLQSELSRADYCRKNDIHPNTMYRWEKQFKVKKTGPGSFVEITTERSVPHNRQEGCITIQTEIANVLIPANIGNDQITFLFSLMGLAHVS